MAKSILALGVGVALTLALALTGFGVWAGAHPFWAVRTAAMGAALAVPAFGLLVVWRRKWPFAAGVGALGLISCLWLARIGKTRFAASYAEDQLAGQFWFFGWIGVWFGLTLLLASLVAGILAGRRR